MQQLSNLDAAFLHLESANTPMHIGCILSFEHPESERMTFERFKTHIALQLPRSPVFRRRLSRLPLDFDRPYWVEDSNFDIDQHVQSARINKESLSALTDQFFETGINTRLALWSMLYIEEIDGTDDQFTVLIKFHHAAIDGVSGEKILTAIMSTNKQGNTALEDHWQPHPPSATVMLANKLRAWWRAPKELTSLKRQLKQTIEKSQALRSRAGTEQPEFFTAPKTPYNRSIDNSRHIASTHLSLRKIKEIKNAIEGCTVNDVVLAICAGALREQLLSDGQLPAKPIIAMSPVSKRQGDEQDNGNLISAMLVSLATDVSSPIERLLKIQQNAQQAKRFNREVEIEQVLKHLPSLTTSLTLKAYSRLRLARAVNPIFNLIITNVPGSPVPLYLDGAKLTALSGMAPIVDNMGLTLVVTSYLDQLTISMTTVSQMKAPIKTLMKNLASALDELYTLTTPFNHQHTASTVVANQVAQPC